MGVGVVIVFHWLRVGAECVRGFFVVGGCVIHYTTCVWSLLCLQHIHPGAGIVLCMGAEQC